MRRDFARLIAGDRSQVQARGAPPREDGARPALSAQQTAALAALAVRQGYSDLASLRGPARELFATLTNDQLRTLAEAGRSDGDRRIGTSGGAAPRAH